MKHLISLSFKYIRRQKLRSVLTFLCITLSVFILNTLSAYFSSIITTAKNQVIKDSGAWEVDFSEVINIAVSENKNEDAINILANHAAVNDYYVNTSQEFNLTSFRDIEGNLNYLEIELDNNIVTRAKQFFLTKVGGNSDLHPHIGARYTTDKLKENEVYAPSWLKDLGYEKGDTLTFSVTPVRAKIDENSAQVKQTLERLEQLQLDSDKTKKYEISDDFSEKEEIVYATHTESRPLLQYMLDDFTFDEIEFTDVQKGTSSESITVKIADFADSMDYGFSIICSSDFRLDLNELYTSNEVILVEDSDYYYHCSAYAVMSDNIDLEDSVNMVFTDLGFDESDFYNYFTYEGDGSGGSTYNNMLLALKFKGANVIATLLPLIILALFITFIVWAISRFVIDNAFEISVQERSRQFAALRIMGASKAQLLALVMAEAVFYSVTALPIGVLAAFLMCRSVMISLHNVGFSSFEFDVNPVITFIGILLCICAIFISAYTSAMWAAKKLSPAEALNYGKPKISKRKAKAQKHRKSKLNNSSRAFMISYTLKNIFRTKKRFLISTIAMALGVLMFTLCLLFGMYVGIELNEQFSQDFEGYDFYTVGYGYDSAKKAESFLSENDNFSAYRIKTSCHMTCASEEDMQIIRDMTLYELPSGYHFQGIMHISRKDYEAHLEQLTGISYDEFEKSGTALLYTSPYGYFMELDDDGNPVRKYDNSYKAVSEFGHTENPEIHFSDNSSVRVSGVVCTEKLIGADPHCLLVPSAMAEKIFSDTSSAVNIYATVKDHSSYIEAEKEFSEFCNLNTDGYFTNEYMAYTGLHEFISAIIKAVLAFLISIWLVGILSMVNSINTSVLNRQSELIMMRSVGMSKKQLIGTVVLESMLFSAFSSIIGTLLGVLSFWCFGTYIVTDIRTSFFALIPVTIIISVIVNILIAAASALPGIRNLKKSLNQNRM